MVLKYSEKIKADVIILGSNLPGIVTAHKLKKKFGSSMDIVVLDFATKTTTESRCNVIFQGLPPVEDDSYSSISESEVELSNLTTVHDNVAKLFLAQYADEFSIPLPDDIISPTEIKSPLNKVFQHLNGEMVYLNTDYHDFKYLNFFEKFELNQYQELLDYSMKNLFHSNLHYSESERSTLMYYDRTTMEQHICSALLLATSREIMRTTVRLVCGAPANTVSVLFYLHQCFRTSSSRNHLGGDNTRFREKLLGFCKKRLALKLQQSVSDITYRTKPIIKIKACPNQKVILETKKGDTTYVCDLLALALRPDELSDILIEEDSLSQEFIELTKRMIPGHTKKFVIQYEENFWERQGYSGDILSICGPIVWAMERPMLSATGCSNKYAALIGYLKVPDDASDSQEAVIEQLTKLFGPEARTPASYRESTVVDMFIPPCGQYVALRRMVNHRCPKHMEWRTLDIFADGDVVAALEAGHTAYNHLLASLRPQAQTFEDLRMADWPKLLAADSLMSWLAHVNWISSMRWSAYLAVTVMAVRYFCAYTKK